MGCDVCIGTDSIDESYEFTNRTEPKARKVHVCEECHREIKPGEKYERQAGLYEGKIDVHKTCMLCVEIREVFRCGKSYYFGQLWEAMHEHAFEQLTMSSECFTELSAAAKERVLEEWREWKGLR